ncbi:facilitated trehalose transporter Tret1-like [Vanessa cardui]|uniref:facilitated trehalose transporter Tret1-like n=1 Tax=Vanessa cardui TaxID=171605 RepID=UPI001F144179|nr:facilitated trehalose transporter Tret1-like [Vanessa cardui]
MTPQTLRQVLVGISLAISCISDGFIFGQMSGMINGLQSKESTITLTSEDISWIASIINIFSIIGFAVTGTITDLLGRKKAMTVINSTVAACWIFLYFAKNKTMLLLSRLILGVCFGGGMLLVFINIGEYITPSIRPISINLIVCVGCLIGTTLGHTLSVLFHWRYVALMDIIPSGLATILPLFWVESPTWLASKGKFDKCEKAFRALHPLNKDTENELKLILAYERKKQNESSHGNSKFEAIKNLFMTLTKKYYWKIFGICVISNIYRIATCRILFSTLAISMLQDITASSDILLFTLVIDGLTTVAAVSSCAILVKFKIRDTLFVSGVIANMCLIIFALSLYLCPGNDFYLSWLKVLLMALYFMIVTAGPYPVLDILMSEIYPPEMKSCLAAVTGSAACILQFICIKFASSMISEMGYHGLFLSYATVIFLCLIYLWFYLPETKGRTLHEIEYFFKNGTFDYNKEAFNLNQTSNLLNDVKS